MAFDYNIFWTTEAVNCLETILNDLSHRLTPLETENIKGKLSRHLSLIQQNPFLFPISQYNSRLRKTVLGNQITVFYEVTGHIIYLIHLFNNKENKIL